jgi:hypothetical protein
VWVVSSSDDNESCEDKDTVICEYYGSIDYCGYDKSSKISGGIDCFWNGDDSKCISNSSVESCNDILIKESCYYDNTNKWYSFLENSEDENMRCVWVKEMNEEDDSVINGEKCEANINISNCLQYFNENDCNKGDFKDINNNNDNGDDGQSIYRGCFWRRSGDVGGDNVGECTDFLCENYNILTDTDLCVSNPKNVLERCILIEMETGVFTCSNSNSEEGGEGGDGEGDGAEGGEGGGLDDLDEGKNVQKADPPVNGALFGFLGLVFCLLFSFIFFFFLVLCSFVSSF